MKKTRFFLHFINIQEEELVIPTYVPFVEKRNNIDRSTLYSFSGPFELLHVDIADISFFAKSAADPHYCLLFLICLHKRYILSQ